MKLEYMEVPHLRINKGYIIGSWVLGVPIICLLWGTLAWFIFKEGSIFTGICISLMVPLSMVMLSYDLKGKVKTYGRFLTVASVLQKDDTIKPEYILTFEGTDFTVEIVEDNVSEGDEVFVYIKYNGSNEKFYMLTPQDNYRVYNINGSNYSRLYTPDDLRTQLDY